MIRGLPARRSSADDRSAIHHQLRGHNLVPARDSLYLFYSQPFVLVSSYVVDLFSYSCLAYYFFYLCSRSAFIFYYCLHFSANKDGRYQPYIQFTRILQRYCGRRVWRNGIERSASDPKGRGFESRPVRLQITALGKLRLHACASVTKQNNLVPAYGR